LRGTYQGSSFKGLATGSQRENGWFSFVRGEGQLKRIVLVESAIDALSAAALAELPGKAIFVSTDGAGSIPVTWLQQQGVVIVAAHDQDRAGEEMAWRLAAQVSDVTRATPAYGKDWNEQLLDMASKLDSSEWKLIAQAIGKPDAYVSRIIAVVNAGQPLPIEAQSAMQQDFSTYKQLSNDLWQWHQVARSSGYSDAYLKRIAEVAITLHHPQKPIPLSENAKQAMQQDVPNYSQVNRKSHCLQLQSR
jgi:Toprim-like